MRTQPGFTLLEALIAVLIIALGLLGLSSLQIVSLRTTNEGFLRTQATALAHDMAERIRANLSAVENNLFANLDSFSTGFCHSTPQTCSGSSAYCDFNQLAQHDFYSVACGNAGVDGVHNLLPQGQLQVSCDDPATTSDVICRITVSWRELAEQGASPATTLSQVDLRIQP